MNVLARMGHYSIFRGPASAFFLTREARRCPSRGPGFARMRSSDRGPGRPAPSPRSSSWKERQGGLSLEESGGDPLRRRASGWLLGIAQLVRHAHCASCRCRDARARRRRLSLIDFRRLPSGSASPRSVSPRAHATGESQRGELGHCGGARGGSPHCVHCGVPDIRWIVWLSAPAKRIDTNDPTTATHLCKLDARSRSDWEGICGLHWPL